MLLNWELDSVGLKTAGGGSVTRSSEPCLSLILKLMLQQNEIRNIARYRTLHFQVFWETCDVICWVFVTEWEEKYPRPILVHFLRSGYHITTSLAGCRGVTRICVLGMLQAFLWTTLSSVKTMTQSNKFFQSKRRRPTQRWITKSCNLMSYFIQRLW